MTNIESVSQELKSLASLSDEEISSYERVIAYTVGCVGQMLNDTADENDARIIHLCAVKAYYQLALVQNDFVSSFKAGEVSYSVDTSMPARARALVDDAMRSCSDLIKKSDFDFRVV